MKIGLTAHVVRTRWLSPPVLISALDHSLASLLGRQVLLVLDRWLWGTANEATTGASKARVATKERPAAAVV